VWTAAPARRAWGGARGRGVPTPRVVAEGQIDQIVLLGQEFLTFLAATVVVVPVCNRLKVSPILGFLLSGFLLDQTGLLSQEGDLGELSELGVLFLLFEMGLELNIDRLTALAKYAFILGSLQIAVSTAIFTGFELPVGNALGSNLLEGVLGASPGLVEIRSVLEAIVIGAGLSLSSSAFVLQLLAEKGDLPTRYGSATLGILLMQDIAVVPLLVLLPLVSNTGDGGGGDIMATLVPTFLKAGLGLGLLLYGGRTVLRRLFEIVSESKSPEAFIALCLLTVTGTSVITTQLGLSSTLGAFMAGVLLAETSFRNQVEADIRPFRGLLLGLFFVTTGTNIDYGLLSTEWPNVMALTAGLVAIKAGIVVALGPLVGLKRSESVRTGFVLSQGGEFAFVVFTLANQLQVLPENLNRLLIVVVIVSMVLTPALASLGDYLGDKVEAWEDSRAPGGGEMLPVPETDLTEPVVILGFNQAGQVLANLMSTPKDQASLGPVRNFVAFDLEPKRVNASRKMGLPVYYGDGANKAVLHAAGVDHPHSVCVCYSSVARSTAAVERLRSSFGPSLPIFARARDLAHAVALEHAGATGVAVDSALGSLRLGGMVLREGGAEANEVEQAAQILEVSMLARARLSAGLPAKPDEQEICENQKSLSAVMGAPTEGLIELQTLTLEAEGEAAVAVLKKADSFQWQDGAVDVRPDCSDSDTYEECLADTFYVEPDVPEAPQKQSPRSS